MSERPKLRAIDQARAATHLHGLLGAKEVLDIVRPRAPPRERVHPFRIVLGLAATCGIVVVVLWASRHLEERARLAELSRIEAEALTARADAMSWDIVASTLLDNEIMPDSDVAGPSNPNQLALRSPAKILRLHGSILTRQSGPAWNNISSGQRSKLTAILSSYIAAFERAQRTRGLEDQLYCRRGLSLSSNLQPTEAQDQFDTMTDLPALFAALKGTWASIPSDVPRDHVKRLLSLTEARMLLIDEEMALLRFLAENARAWKVQRRNSDKVDVPVFTNRALREQFTVLLKAEANRYAALQQNASQLMGARLARQLKPIR